MSGYLAVHHVRHAVKDIKKFSNFLIEKLKFQPFAERQKTSESDYALVLKHQEVLFVLQERVEDVEVKDGFLQGNTCYPTDTACDVCLECDYVDDIAKQSISQDQSRIKIPLSEVKDDSGLVKYAVIQSPIGNVRHTVVDLTHYSGPFLPGFQLIDEADNILTKPGTPPNLFQTIDHLAFALEIGQTQSIMNWYNNCFGFQRMIINVSEDLDNGFVVTEGAQGMRLRALKGPNLCADKCIGNISKSKVPEIAKFVFGESLEGFTESCQVSFFIKQHKGIGLQHIAFGTSNLIHAMEEMRNNGLTCLSAPDNYYSEGGKSRDIISTNNEVDRLKSNCILVESHMDVANANENIDYSITNVQDQLQQLSRTNWFIMQVFTRPVFEDKTVFFEFIQRFQTQSGFGAGNIGSLWKSIQKELFVRQDKE